MRAALEHLIQEEGVLGSNPSSVHAHGRLAKKYLTEARERVATSLGTSPDDLIFTSCGTEANQLVIRSVLEPRLTSGKKPHWITTPVEHECNLKMQEWVRERGGSVSVLPVDSSGAPIISEFAQLVRPETALVSVIWVNNETGVITDVETLARECQARGIPLHVDGAQAWGKIPVRLKELGVTYAAFAAHKIGALSGTGVLYLKPGAELAPLIQGKQERSRRGGTENLIGIVAAGAAAHALQDAAYWEAMAPGGSVERYRDRLQAVVTAHILSAVVNGGQARRVPNTLSLCFEGVEKDGMVAALDLEGFSVSSGSACSSGVVEPSHVLLALGRSRGLASAGVRISISRETSWEDLERFVPALERVVTRFRKSSPQISTQTESARVRSS